MSAKLVEYPALRVRDRWFPSLNVRSLTGGLVATQPTRPLASVPTLPVAPVGDCLLVRTSFGSAAYLSKKDTWRHCVDAELSPSTWCDTGLSRNATTLIAISR